MSFADEWLDHCRDLTREPGATSSEVGLRRCVSAAYYAVFHEMTQAAARQAAPPGAPAGLLNGISRSFSHSIMGAGCKLIATSFSHQAEREAGGQKEGQPLPRLVPPVQRLGGGRVSPQMNEICLAFLHLQAERHEADYAPDTNFSAGQALHALRAAESLFRLHRGLDPVEAAAMYFLLRTPTRDLRLG